MGQYIFLGVLIAIQIARGSVLNLGGKSVKFLWVSLYVISVPFEVGRVFGSDLAPLATGTLSPVLKLTLPMVLTVALLFQTNFNKVFKFKIYSWVTGIMLLTVLAFINPFNQNVFASIVFAVFILSNVIFFKVLSGFVDSSQFIQGLFDGFFILCIIQLILAICFPVLGLIEVTNLFHSGTAEWATRMGQREGAVGLFLHPGALALYTVISSSFFISTFFFNYKKKPSLIILLINCVTIFLTYSRTSYLAITIVAVFLNYVKVNRYKNIFSFLNIIKFIVPTALLVGWLIFLSPLKDSFLKSDSQTQFMNRTLHYSMAYKMFTTSPLIGVGLNSHLSYVRSHPIILSEFMRSSQVEFFKTNPIHNIHLIVLAETGIIGFVLWIGFLITNIVISKKQLAKNFNQIMSLTFMGTIVGVGLYGTTGWSPFSAGVLPFFLLIGFFAIEYNDKNITLTLVRLKDPKPVIAPNPELK